ncbi:hypothetical protein FA13DRAFT_1472307 [Coprinellus micaceus]|uniref:Uncharacterized protein n=1 Tax=Coprinellus micaceus TaxID=71717 RepID=A0A4Y7SM21_COPMI|nr:hypothetical protein FA13DRAFT_1472307 [Coprinellus micaceus]
MATLTQSAVLRLPGPSWDEEVVPALRKRLESESRTISKRMSTISLSGDEVVVKGTYAAYNGGSNTMPTPTTYTTSKYLTNGSDHFDSEYASRSATASANPNKYPNTANRPSTTTTTNGSSRSRTYSQPDGVKMNLKPNGSVSSQAKPTRIPQPSKTYAAYSNGNTPVVPQSNGFVSSSPPLENYNFPSTSTSKYDRSVTGLMNESPPFPPSSSSASSMNHDQEGGWMDAAPSRQSMESEEQPFEHWYRGEVSRNGGVGELRVGKRQEMLDIANYGHMIRNQELKAKQERSAALRQASGRGRSRKRAGSIGGLTDRERVRESVYFDEVGMQAVSRVLDEHPLTDLEDEGMQSDVASLSSFHRVEHNYIAGVGDISTTTVVTPALEEDLVTPRMPSEDRSITPTQLSNSQRSQYPPTRIPGRARKSSEHRSTTPTHTRASLNNSTSSTSTAKLASPPVTGPSGSRTVSGQSVASGSQPGLRKGPSPPTPNPAPKKRVPVKSLKGKQTPVRLPQNEKRESVGQYPAVDNEADLSNAIPSWTQPVPRSGNWDEVVLPVVARSKGMKGHYQTAHGKADPRKPVDDRPEPAPGTFGIKEWKQRPHQTGDHFIGLEEFGQLDDQNVVEDECQPRRDDEKPERPHWPLGDSYNQHEQTVLPARGDPPPSPPPFAHYFSDSQRPKPEADLGAAENGGVVVENGRRRNERMEEDEGAGCCKCEIM